MHAVSSKLYNCTAQAQLNLHVRQLIVIVTRSEVRCQTMFKWYWRAIKTVLNLQSVGLSLCLIDNGLADEILEAV